MAGRVLRDSDTPVTAEYCLLYMYKNWHGVSPSPSRKTMDLPPRVRPIHFAMQQAPEIFG
eukprot:9459047-Pyramimonas_sp.AAC.1